MNYKKLVTNALVAFSAQGISLVVSFVMSLLVPKILGVASYGYWQLFIFYVGYSGFFHFGLNDGVYLVEGGKARNEINKVVINSQFRVAVCLQVAIGVLVCLLSSVMAPEEERAFVIYAFSLYTVISNLQLYLGYVFQAMNETKLFFFFDYARSTYFPGSASRLCRSSRFGLQTLHRSLLFFAALRVSVLLLAQQGFF